MAKKFKYVPLEEETHKRFKQIKKILELAKGKEYSMSEFQNYLLDLAKPARLS